MQNDLFDFNQRVNHTRFLGQPTGHYESFFLRANHPARPLAFWIRYTIFSPKDRPDNALGELWAIFFNGESNEHAVAKQEFPIAECRFETSAFDVQIGAATLSPHFLQGMINGKNHTVAWELEFDGNSAPLLLLPISLYAGKFPAAKSLVSLPLAKFTGSLSVDGEAVPIVDWIGSQNHNWGTRHTDLYAWGQVAGFDLHPGSFLEVATARLRVGPIWTPPITPLVLRHQQKEYVLTGLAQAIKAKGRFGYFTWEFSSNTSLVEIEGQISAPRQSFVGLNYLNPPGGIKHCLNSKIASCTVRLKDKATGAVEVLETTSRAAFEILTNDRSHGVEITA